MTIHLRQSRRRVRIPSKFGDTICKLNNKNKDQLEENCEQLLSYSSINGSEEFGGNSRVCEDEVEMKSYSNRNKRIEEGEISMGSNDDKMKHNKQFGENDQPINKPMNVSPVPMQVNVQCDTVKTWIGNGDNKNYAEKVTNMLNEDDKLKLIPTVLNENGQEYVIFDDEIVKEGSKKWEFSACGYFVGFKMSIQELRYNLYRMWSKFGLKHVLNNGNGVFVFKFDNKQGLQSVIESGSWIVNNKPMVVQKWDPSVILDRNEPNTLPLWIKLMNPPLEAWSNVGLSALASGIGNPLIMDAMTTRMCNQGIGSFGYARILVEAKADKGLENHIEILYRGKDTSEQMIKKVKVEYDWKPPLCPCCKVFGHTDSNCPKSSKMIDTNNDNGKDTEGFVKVGRRKETVIEGKRKVQYNKWGNRVGFQKFEYRQKNKTDNGNDEGKKKTKEGQDNYNTPKQTQRKSWTVDDNVIKDVRNTANKFIVLQDLEKSIKISKKDKDEVEKYVLMELQPSSAATNKWSKEMKEYFKEKRKIQYEKKKNAVEDKCDEIEIELDEKDVVIDRSRIADFMTTNEVSSMGNDSLSKV
ncbi:RNA-directed DNA polymerase, eukaryota, reverse transcriptase zinc-binding domain protein [Tanacetum coccineum]